MKSNEIPEKIKIVIDPQSVLNAVLVIIGTIVLVYIAWLIRSVIFIFFISFIIASTLRPIIDKAEKKLRIPRVVTASIIFLLVTLLISGLGYLVVKDITKELKYNNVVQIFENLEERVETVVPDVDFNPPMENIPQNENNNSKKQPAFSFDSISQGTNIILDLFSGTIGSLLMIFSVFLIAMYLLSKKKNVYDGLITFLPTENRDRVKKYINKIETKLGSWLLAQFILMLIIGSLTYLGFSIPALFIPTDAFTLGKYAVTLAVIAGFLEIIPNLGPIITVILTVILAIATSNNIPIAQIIYVIAFFTFIQQMEAYVIVPRVIKQAVGIDPIVTILSILSASIVFGPIGAVIIIPIVAIAQLSIEYLVAENKKNK